MVLKLECQMHFLKERFFLGNLPLFKMFHILRHHSLFKLTLKRHLVKHFGPLRHQKGFSVPEMGLIFITRINRIIPKIKTSYQGVKYMQYTNRLNVVKEMHLNCCPMGRSLSGPLPLKVDLQTSTLHDPTKPHRQVL